MNDPRSGLLPKVYDHVVQAYIVTVYTPPAEEPFVFQAFVKQFEA